MALDVRPLIDAETLAAHLAEPHLRIIDIRYDASAEQDFEAGHIPGSVHSNYATEGWRGAAGGIRNVAPDEADLAALLGRIGLRPEDHAVIVSPFQNPNHASGATRAYWTLKYAGHERVSVLNGGWRAWTADPGRPVETGRSQVTPAASYPVRLDRRILSDLAATEAALEAGDATLLDARARSYFIGDEKSGDVARFGRLPGAVGRNYADAFDPASGLIRPLDELKALYASIPDAPTVSYCNTGHTASLNWFVLSELFGRADQKLFDGSLSQWALDPARPMATGD